MNKAQFLGSQIQGSAILYNGELLVLRQERQLRESVGRAPRCKNVVTVIFPRILC
jgi:hypothetical protein